MIARTEILVRTAASIGVSVLTLGILVSLAGHLGGPVDAAGVVKALRSIVPIYLFAYFVCALGQTWVRAVRYRVLLHAGGEEKVPGLGHMMLVTMSRNMFVDLLPARLGEASYLFLLNRGYRMKMETCISSLAVSFIFDIIALLAVLPFLFVILALQSVMPGWMLIGFLILVAATGLVCWILFSGGPAAAAWLGRREKLLFPGWGVLVAFIGKCADAISQTAKAGVTGRIFLLSLGVRAFKYTAMMAVFLAVALPSFPAAASAGPIQILISLISAEAAASMPVPSFMSFGAYEAGGTAALSALGIGVADALICMLAVHIASQVIDYSLGGIGLLLFAVVGGHPVPVPARRFRELPLRSRVFALCMVFFVGISVAFTWYQHRAMRKMGSLKPPDPGVEAGASDDDRARVGRYLGDSTGFVVWSSNRSGNHDLYRMDLPSMVTRRLTDHPHTEYYPRISPDGSRLLFSRSHRPWVSQRNVLLWDTYLMDLQTGEVKLAATNANTATWAGSDEFIFQREGNRVVLKNLATGMEEGIYPKENRPHKERYVLHTPYLHPDHRDLAVTVRGASSMTAVVSPGGGLSRVGRGCQLAWMPGSRRLLLVDHIAGANDNAFVTVDKPGDKPTLFFDAPGAFSHEYFPQLSSDRLWLVYGASQGGHEHDTADYEIFLWKTEDETMDPVRLTFHSGNDCWPDIFMSIRR